MAEIADLEQQLHAAHREEPPVAASGTPLGDDSEGSTSSSEEEAEGQTLSVSSAQNGESPLEHGAASQTREIPMEQVLADSVLLSLATTMKNVPLPILMSNFYAQHVLPASERLKYGVPLNVKETRCDLSESGSVLDLLELLITVLSPLGTRSFVCI